MSTKYEIENAPMPTWVEFDADEQLISIVQEAAEPDEYPDVVVLNLYMVEAILTALSQNLDPNTAKLVTNGNINVQ